MVFSVNPSLRIDVPPPSEKKSGKWGNGNSIIVGDSQTSLLLIFSEGGGTSVQRVHKSWICGITSCMYVSLICPGMWLFPAMPGGGYSQYDGLYGEALPEILERFSTNICTRRLCPEVQPLTRRESVLYLWLIPILWQRGFPAVKTDTKF